MTIEFVKQLRLELAQVLQSELGTYSRPPPLPNVVAISVADRAIPSLYKVLVAPMTKDPIPAAEVVIQSSPLVKTVSRNLADRFVDEVFRVWIILHDPRQDGARIVHKILANFQTASDAAYLPSSDLNQRQIVINLKHSITIRNQY